MAACATCAPIVTTKRVEPDNQPCPQRCRRCSLCIRSLAYWARGGRDYLGVEGELRMTQVGS